MKRRSGAQPLVGKPAEVPADVADRTLLLPAEPPSEKPESGVSRTSRSRVTTTTLGSRLVRIEQRIKVPREVEDRIVSSLVGRASSDTLDQPWVGLSERLDAMERDIEVPKDVEDRIVGAILQRLGAERRARARKRIMVILLTMAAGIIVLSLTVALRHVAQRGP